jgi:hypothetical protein
MRLWFVVAVGWIGLAGSTQLALADKKKLTCDEKWSTCMKIARDAEIDKDPRAAKMDKRCDDNVIKCRNSGKWANLPGKFASSPKPQPEPKSSSVSKEDDSRKGAASKKGSDSKPATGSKKEAEARKDAAMKQSSNSRLSPGSKPSSSSSKQSPSSKKP